MTNEELDKLAKSAKAYAEDNAAKKAKLGSSSAEYHPYSGPRFSIQSNEVESLDKVIPDISNKDSARKARDILIRHKKKTFVEKLAGYVGEKSMTAKDVYTAAQIDRKLYSKILSDPEYKPAKDTCMAIALALGLSRSEAGDLLSRAGYTFSDSSTRDLIIEYFFVTGQYDIDVINDVLYRLGEPILGDCRF